MMRGARRTTLAAIAAAIGLAPGCMLLLDTGGYSTRSDAGAPSALGSGDGGNGGVGDSGKTEVEDSGMICTYSANGMITCVSPPRDADLYDSGLDASGTSFDASICAPAASDDACTTCKKNSCCTALLDCLGTSSCQSLYNCESTCTTPPCTCADAFPQGAALYAAYVACVESSCPTCVTLSTGDPCQSAANCPTNATCTTAGWCTPTSCFSSSESCQTSVSDGTNLFGQQNACITDTADENICFPGCAVQADCAAFAGTVCVAATSVESRAVMVCASQAADAGDE